MGEKFSLNGELSSRLSRRNFVRMGGVVAGGLVAGGLALPGRAMTLDALVPGGVPRGTYVNPVIRGDHPDAGALRVGDDYYLTHTTDRHTPGLLLWHSRDLVHWKAVGAALDEYYGAIWAPYLCEHKGHFYIYYPCDGKLTVIHAEHPTGPWSKPIPLGIGGIDPGHIATPEGRRYLYMAGGSFVELAADGLSAITKPKHVVNDWPIPENWEVECSCQEAPKLFFRDGYYYLTVAEGGTSGPPTSHMVLSARSRSAEGPWEWSPLNPIVHTKSAAEKWWSKGHGRPLEAADGTWWMTLHSYENGYRTLGRQVLLLPVEWTADGWYRVPAGVTGGEPIRKKALAAASETPFTFAGTALAGAASTGLDVQWQFWKGYDASRVQLVDGTLTLKADGDSIANTSLLTRAAVDHTYTVEVDVEVEADCEAGLLLFYDGAHVVGLRLSAEPHGGRGSKGLTLVRGTRATLRIVNDNQVADFLYKVEGAQDGNAGDTKWTRLRGSLDVTCYNQNALGGFLDLRPALYACGAGTATFRNWRYVARADQAV